MKDLTVRIPKRFKKGLTLRFSPPEKGENTDHCVECPLCKEYLKKEGCGEGCGEGCPFTRFRRRGFSGCFNWLEQVSEDRVFGLLDSEIFWDSDDRKIVMKQLRLLRKRSKELIEWVEN